MTQAKTVKAADAQSLLDFARERQRAEMRAACVVCRLPEAIRTEIRAAKKVTRRDVMAWLAARHHITVTDSDLQSHRAGHHDD